jgi:hypothetical protein
MADSAERYNSVLEIINERLIPDATAKKARGEVFTPLNLVREMLFGIRKSAIDKDTTEIWGIDKEGNFFDDNEDDRVGGIPLSIWRNPQTKWLDPANGIGNFPVVAFYMLDYQLGKHGPEEFKGDKHKLKRRNHIVEKMLYMIELDKGNVNTARKIFKKIAPGSTPNIICTNTLEITDERLNTVFKGVNRFDVVMGNPPFNPGILWAKFIEKFLDKTQILLFIVPSTFTSNQTGKPMVEALIKNGLRYLKYLDVSDFEGVDLDMLYFHTDKKYKDSKLLINNHTNVKYTESIINYKDKKEISIFKKLKELEHLVLYRGKNNTLAHKNPIETDNIKFKKNAEHPHKMISRLGGGNIEYYWVKTFEKEDSDTPKILFPRGTASWNSFNNIIKFDKDLVFTTSVDKGAILSDGIMYTPMNSLDEFENYRFYLMRSKIVRFIFLRINHLAELTKFIYEYIPKIPVKSMGSDKDIYESIELTPEEINYIDKLFKDLKPITKRKQIKTVKANKGGSRKPHRVTRKIRR